jgi:hypothetical protein
VAEGEGVDGAEGGPGVFGAGDEECGIGLAWPCDRTVRCCGARRYASSRRRGGVLKPSSVPQIHRPWILCSKYALVRQERHM